MHENGAEHGLFLVQEGGGQHHWKALSLFGQIRLDMQGLVIPKNKN